MDKSGITLKEKLLALSNIVAFKLPNDDAVYYMRRMTCGEREVFLTEQKADNVWHSQRMMLALTLCDESGIRLFDAPDELKPIDMAVIDELSKKAFEINGFTKTAEDDIKKN